MSSVVSIPKPRPAGPRLVVDIVVFTGYVVDPIDRHVLLIQRGTPPYLGRWALPGGHLEHGETLAEAAARELREETGIAASVERLHRLGIYDDPARDPRGHVVSVCYLLVLSTMPAPAAGDDAAAARWVPLTDALRDDALAFDHHTLLVDAVNQVRDPRTPPVR
ncbi:hypothetical protein Acsp05_71350 [Actinokineospora sp. NBRC 105648]|nr:hypothetical protein Acsp05_71350 [Actinokineospora sp. NBRC 105648]